MSPDQGDRLRWHAVALPADRITASLRLRAVKIATLENELEAHTKLLRNLRSLLPFAARRLPPEVLDCFDERQRLVKPLPGNLGLHWPPKILRRPPPGTRAPSRKRGP
jgi:hypothetical protein